jgi:hypothetical protein
MKKKLLLLLLVLFSASAFAKEFHFIYIRLDHSMDKDVLKEEIMKLKSEYANSDFVLFYSNEKVVMDTETWDEKELSGLISHQISTLAISVSEELEFISELLGKYLQLEIVKDTFGLKKIVSKLDYDLINFDCFVGDDFFNNDYQNSLLSRMLFVNSLNQEGFNVDIFYYVCGASYDKETIKFNSQYTIKKEPKIK